MLQQDSWNQSISLSRQQMESIYQDTCEDCNIQYRSPWKVAGIGYEIAHIVFSFIGEKRRYKVFLYRYMTSQGSSIKFGSQCPLVKSEAINGCYAV